MKWWYTPQRETIHKWDEYEDVVFAIASVCRFKRKTNIVPNYYIYNDNGLVDIIKGSELDPLSILRTCDETDGNMSWMISNYSEELEDSDDEFERTKKIVRRTFTRTPEQERNANEQIEICKELLPTEESKMEQILEKGIFKEFGMKYVHGDIASVYVKNMAQISTYKLASTEDRDLRNIPIILDELFDMRKLTEEYCFVFAYNGSNLLGYTIISHGTANRVHMDAKVIFRFLLLVGATDYVIVHNHPLGKARMSQEDYEITKSLLEASEFMNIEMIEHIIIGKNDWSEILMQIGEMDANDIEDVHDYYENYYEEE